MLQVAVNKNNYSITREDGVWMINGTAANVDICPLPNGQISILLNGRSFTAIPESTDRKKKTTTLSIGGRPYEMHIKEPIDQLLSNMGMDMSAMAKVEPIKAPMPGLVLRLLVQPGQEIVKGDSLLVLEAMKMENVLKASGPGKVKAIKVAERTAVEKGMVLIEME
jgi:biotin carboxyl carrier protein